MMKSIPKLIRRFTAILLLSLVLLFALNVLLLATYTFNQLPNAYPWKTAEEVAADLFSKQQPYKLSEKIASELEQSDAWAILIDSATMQVVWQTENLPETIPRTYSISDIVGLTRGYIDGYPTFTGEAKEGLVVLGYPKDRFWKHMWPSWDYQFIASLPKTALTVFGMNLVLIFLIYMTANSRLLKSVKPILAGIQSLPANEPVYVPERGVLSELAVNINKTSEVLQTQSRQLRKREDARANWIAGVSHDIRTPLSMIMGYAGQLEEEPYLTEADRKKAAVIVKQSERMKNLINDLNLASKLEYNMQPVRLKRENMVTVVRQVIVDFMNMDLGDRYPIAWETKETCASCMISADKELIRRAVGNLIWNCINHNEQGCHIYVLVMTENGKCVVIVADNGAGATGEQMDRLNHSPHYMVCDKNTTVQRHGLGLLIVRQIIAAHKGEVVIRRSEEYGGFEVRLSVPMEPPVNPAANRVPEHV